MRIATVLGSRVFRHGFVFTTTLLTCTALQADHNDQHGSSTEKFIQKAAMGGQMEVQMGQLAQQKGQAQEVKSLGSTLVRDHTQANERLQQLASTKNITLDNWSGTAADHRTTSTTASPSSSTTRTATTDQTTDHASSGVTDHSKSDGHAMHAKHQKELDKLRSQSGAEFDKTLVRMAIKDHKKDIAEFEHARTELNDPEVKAFIDQQLPALRNHLQLAQSAAKVVGVNESTIASDKDDDTDTAVGAPATGATGTRGSDKPSSPASAPDKPRSSYNSSDRLNGSTDSDISGTVVHNNPTATVDATAGDHSVSAQSDIDRNNSTASTEITTEKKHKVFQKGDGKVLGLSTDKNDGKFLGIIPDPHKKNKKDASVNADVDVNGHEASVGAAATTETGSSDRGSDQK